MHDETRVASRYRGIGRGSGVTALVLGSVLAVSSWSGRAAAAPVSVADGAARIEVADGIDDAERLPEWIAERNPELVQQLADAPGREHWVAVEIDGRYLDYRYRVVAMRDGAALGGPSEWVACGCSNDDLLVGIDEGIAAAVQRLREPVESGHETPGGEHVGLPEHGTPEAEYRKMTGLGTAGLVVGVLGVGGVATGAVLVGRGEQAPAGYQHLQRDFRPPGVGMLVGGGVLLGTGVAMLVTDLVQCRNHHPRCLVREKGGSTQSSRRRSMVLAPWLGGRIAGVAGRF